eukprot:682570-Lingulodinium_polyedra.AAC.1
MKPRVVPTVWSTRAPLRVAWGHRRGLCRFQLCCDVSEFAQRAVARCLHVFKAARGIHMLHSRR